MRGSGGGGAAGGALGGGCPSPPIIAEPGGGARLRAIKAAALPDLLSRARSGAFGFLKEKRKKKKKKTTLGFDSCTLKYTTRDTTVSHLWKLLFQHQFSVISFPSFPSRVVPTSLPSPHASFP